MFFIEKEKVFNYRNEILNIEIHIIDFKPNPNLKTQNLKENPLTNNRLLLSQVEIIELSFGRESLIEQLRSKKVVSLPISSYFNVGNCDYIIFNGKRTHMENYNYLFDYDINIDFAHKQINLLFQGIRSPTTKSDAHIDRGISFLGCSSLRISALLDHKSVS